MQIGFEIKALSLSAGGRQMLKSLSSIYFFVYNDKEIESLQNKIMLN